MMRSGLVRLRLVARAGAWSADVACAVGFFVAAAGASAGVFLPVGEMTARLGILAVVCAVYSAMARNLTAALLTAGLGWMFFNSFVVHAGGVLRWEGTSDLVRVAILAAAAVLGCALGWAYTTVVPTGQPDDLPVPAQRSASVNALPPETVPVGQGKHGSRAEEQTGHK